MCTVNNKQNVSLFIDNCAAPNVIMPLDALKMKVLLSNTTTKIVSKLMADMK